VSEALWSEEELRAALGPPSAPLRAPVNGVSIDTRTLQEGDLFVAIRGEANDGHDFVAKAFEAGAAAAVVAFARADALSEYGSLYSADDTLKALERLGAAARARSKARIVAVTGSVGKTSVKEMLRLALAESGATHASAASYNNHWGVPLTLARLPRGAAFGVFEIGMNHAGEIAALAPQARPHVALMTTIAPVHIEYLGSLEAIADAKAEIFLGLEPDGVAVLNRDAPQFERLAARAAALGARVLKFGESAECDARLVEIREDAGKSLVRMRSFGREVEFRLGAPGRHMALNAVGALLAADALGADKEASMRALENFAPQRGRGERVRLEAPGGEFTLIDESYNANPASMRAALGLLGAAAPRRGGRRIAVIGDMLELGRDGERLHRDLAPALEDNRVDLLFGAGPLTRALFEAAPAPMRAHWAAQAADIEGAVLDAVRAGDVVMVKGSNGSRMGPVVAALRARYAPAAR